MVLGRCRTMRRAARVEPLVLEGATVACFVAMGRASRFRPVMPAFLVLSAALIACVDDLVSSAAARDKVQAIALSDPVTSSRARDDVRNDLGSCLGVHGVAIMC